MAGPRPSQSAPFQGKRPFESLPAPVGAVPWVASKKATESARLAPGARPMPPISFGETGVMSGPVPPPPIEGMTGSWGC